MKLFNRVLLHLSVGIVMVLTLWAVCFYYAMMDEVNDEVDDSLEDYSEWIIMRSLAGEELPSNNVGTNNQFYLKEVSREYAMLHPSVCYKDSMIYISEKKETEPARILTTLFRDSKEQYYQLDVFVPTIEKADLRESIFFLILWLYVALLLAILLINVWVFRKSMKPLYRLLEWMSRNRLGMKKEPLDNDTSTTEFRQLNEAVKNYSEHSENVYDQQKQFIGNASHEMQTPLAVCLNRIEMLMEDEALTEGHLNELAKMHQTLEYATRLNKSLLLLSKIENHQYAEVKEMCLNELVGVYLDDYQEVYSHKNITCSMNVKAPFKVRMNETMGGVLVTNLLKNAYIHNVDGGTIEIEANDDSLVFRNTGEPEPLDANRLFERFYQGKKREGSTGLGLAIARTICSEYHLKLDYRCYNSMHEFIIYR